MSVLKVLSILLLMAAGATGGAAMGGAFSSKKSTTEGGESGAGSASSTTTSSSSSSGSSSVSPTGGASPSSAPASTVTPGAAAPTPTPATWVDLTKETDYATTYNSDTKIGKKYGHLLVGTYGGSTNSNKKWWEKSYAKYQADKANTSDNPNYPQSATFGNEKVTSAFKESNASGEDVAKALNKVCDSVYSQEKTSIEESTTGTNDKTKLRDDLWKYCSPLGERPLTIQDASEDTSYSTDNSMGKNKKAELLAAGEGKNTKLWEIKNNEFKALEETHVSSSAYFKDLLAKVKANPSTKTLKEGCKDVYNKATNSTESATEASEANVVKYCSWKPIATTAAAAA